MAKVIVQQDITYWDGYKNAIVQKTKQISSQKYTPIHSVHYTSYDGTNGVIQDDSDEITFYTDISITPQNTLSIITNSNWDITKDKYTSYTNGTIINDDETFNYIDYNKTPKIFLRKDGTADAENAILYYNGFNSDISYANIAFTGTAYTINTEFKWTSRDGDNSYAEGRDDNIEYTNLSTIHREDGTIVSPPSTRIYDVDWEIDNPYNNYNYNVLTIGGTTYGTTDLTYVDMFHNEAYENNVINNFKSSGNNDVWLNINYNDGFFDRSVSLTKQIVSQPYTNPIQSSNYTGVVPNRDSIVSFNDTSTNNINRVFNVDWSLTDRYDTSSMDFVNAGNDNLQTFLNRDILDVITTTINSNENHTLNEILYFDDGFRGITLSANYTITTTNYSIVQDMEFTQVYTSGKETTMEDVSTSVGLASIIQSDYTIGDDVVNNFNNVLFNSNIEYDFLSPSYMPYDSGNSILKNVDLTTHYDDGWDYVNVVGSYGVEVVPIEVQGGFNLSSTLVVGNNPITFSDNSTTNRTDVSLGLDYVTLIEFDIDEGCV